jgi:hypothetical protein
MRAGYYLAFGLFSLSIVALSTAPHATGATATWISGSQHRAIIDAVRSIGADPAARGTTSKEGLFPNWARRGTSVGETLPDAVDLHSIPKHETYRYAIVNDHRVIVDASSRKVVYVIR